MRFMAEAAPDRFAGIARGFGISFDPADPTRGAVACADRTETFISQLGLPTRLRDVSVPQRDLPAIAGHVAEVMERAAVVPRHVSPADVSALLAAAY